MPKNKPQKKTDGLRQVPLLIFHRTWQREFTVLEDFILHAIEMKGGCSDKEIADALCLEEADVTIILDDEDGIEGVQGDESRRTLSDGFSRMADSIIVVGRWQKGKMPPKNIKEIDVDDDITAFLARLPPVIHSNLSQEQRGWCKAGWAKVYRFAVLEMADEKKQSYRCGKIAVPESLHHALNKFFPSQKPKQQEKGKKGKKKKKGKRP